MNPIIEMNEHEKKIYSDGKGLAVGFTGLLNKILASKSGKINIALSGGSTPRLWFEYLVANTAQDIEWDRLVLFWGDERCVPPDHSESNYGMTRKFLLDHIKIPEENVHRIKGELDPEEAALSYGLELSDHFKKAEVPQFDLLILGLGDDGHTASIFPHEIKLWNSSDLCVVATHPETGQKRVSLSGKVINSAKNVAFLVAGWKKAERLAEIVNRVPIASQYPASLVNPINGKLYWYLDEQAASNLDL